VPGHGHGHRDRQAWQVCDHERRRRGVVVPGHLRHFHRDESAVLTDGSGIDVRGEEHRHEPAGPDRALRHRGR
jgi:hypothetical protein